MLQGAASSQRTEAARSGIGPHGSAAETSGIQGQAQASTGSTTRLGGADVAVDAAEIAQTLYPGLTPGTRPAAAVIVGVEDWPGALAASALAAAPLRAPIIYSERGRLPPASAAALAAIEPLGSTLIGGAQLIVVGDAPAPPRYRALRLRAGSPYQLAAKIAALQARISSRPPRAAIIAGIGGPPALSMPAAGLAAESGSPILLVEQNGLPSATAEAISSLHLQRAYLVGPAQAIDSHVAAQLRRHVAERRIGAPGPVANSIAVAAFSAGPFGWGVDEPGHGLVFALASRPFDAPAAAGLSSSAQFGPLLLLSGADRLPTPLRRYLRDIQPGYGSTPESTPVRGVYNRGWIIGGPRAISAGTQAELDELLRSVPTGNAATPSLLP